MRAVTLVNKSGGSVTDNTAAGIGEALAAAGIDSEVLLVEGKDCAAIAADQVRHGAGLLIAAGGDGTVGAVAGELAGSRTAIGILPLGTLNHFARDLAIPFDLTEAAASSPQASGGASTLPRSTAAPSSTMPRSACIPDGRRPRRAAAAARPLNAWRAGRLLRTMARFRAPANAQHRRQRARLDTIAVRRQ
jgi:hypothetical protein